MRGLLIGLLLVLLVACDSPAARNNSGVAAYEQGDSEDALQAFQRAQVLAPEDALPYANAGAALVRSGALERARLALLFALRNAPPELAAVAYYNLGNLAFQQRRFDEAIAAYQNALLLNPNDEDARYNLELAFQRIEQQADAEAMALPDDASVSTPDSGGAPQSSTATPTPDAPDGVGEMSAADAEAILDAVQSNPGVLPTQQGQSAPSGTEKDW